MEDTVKRNKRIAEWQKDKRTAVLLKDKAKIKAHAELLGMSLNAYINMLIERDMDKRQ